MKILDKKIKRSELKNSQHIMDDEMVKGVVDVTNDCARKNLQIVNQWVEND